MDEGTAVRDIGFIGVGAITEAMVTGVSTVADPPRVMLSPRSARRSSALSRTFSNVTVAEDNQTVLSNSEVVVLALRPQVAEGVLRILAFPEGVRIVSVMATLDTRTVQHWVDPATVVARAVPLPSVATRRGLTAICPSNTEVEALFNLLGGTLTVGREESLDDISAASGTIAAYFEYLSRIQRWLSGRGLDQADAAAYVASLFAPLSDALAAPPPDLAQLAGDHTTPGGLNEYFVALLHDEGAFEAMQRSLDRLARRASGSDTPDRSRRHPPADDM